MIKHRIVFTSNTSFSLYNFRLGIMKKLKENGFEVHAVAPEDEYTQFLQKEFFFHSLYNLNRKGTNILQEILLFLEYLKLYKKINPNLVINYTIKPNIYSSIACRFLRIPSISMITGLGYAFSKGGLLRKLVEVLYRVSLRFNRYVITLNTGDAEVIGHLVSPEKILIYEGEGINADYYKHDVCNEQEDLKITVFLYIGRFLREKGIHELVEAGKLLHKEIDNFEIWLLGSIDKGNPGSLSEDELNTIKSTEFIKVFPFTTDVRSYICKASCVVLPTYGEGTPRSLLEAMAMEKPIITSDITGCRELTSEGNGLLVKPRDAQDLYEKMRRFIMLSQEERKVMGKKSRVLVLRKYDEKIIIKKYLELINEILKNH